MDPHPPEPRLVHPLPPAPQFVGREPELHALRARWSQGFQGVVALVGLGGAGKTAVAARFLDELLQPDAAPKPAGVFVWSFYQQPDAGRFLEEAYAYFAPEAAPATSAKGTGILHLLHDALAKGGPHLLVLDGLERIQRQEDTGAYGQIEDPLLKALLARLAEGGGQTLVIVTSRFPLTDLAAFRDRGYRPVEVGGLDAAAAQHLLRCRGVIGDEAALAELIDAYGAHALTLDHLGGLIGQFLGGDARRAPEAPALTAPGRDRQALRLARLLRAYEEHLPPPELALLCRLCLVRRSLTEEQIGQLFLCTPAVHARTVRELREQIMQLPASQEDVVSNLDLAEAIGACLEEALCTAQLAGPEDAFRGDVLAAAEKVFELPAREADFVELAQLYAVVDLDVQTDLRPLNREDREALRSQCARYLELRAHPLMPFNEKVDPALAAAFRQLGWKKLEKLGPADLTPGDLFRAYKQVQGYLWHLTVKHFALRRVRELCRFHQRKWSLAGPLAPLDAAELRQTLAALVGRHLAVREADGSFSIHPAVRDHFYQLAAASERSGGHDLLREQLVSLLQRPGQRRPEDAATLDLAEEAIYHALQAGRTAEAQGIYEEVLGGLRHLAWKLGEMARGVRILRGFDPCPDPSALAWFLRALGELDEAYARHPMAYFRAAVRLLQGRLPEVAAEGDSARTATAAFLMGRSRTLPPGLLGCAVPRDQLLLYLGRLDVARYTAGLEELYQDFGWEGDRARCRLLLAEVARRQGDMDKCRKHLDAATGWTLHSGSVEHLCLLHLTQARVARTAGQQAAARHALEEGLHLVRRCGLGLYHAELLCEQADLDLAEGDAAAAETTARRAMRCAGAAGCQLVWSVAVAGHLLGQALAAQGRSRPAGAVLRKTLTLRQRLGDPRAVQTERLLERMGGAKG